MKGQEVDPHLVIQQQLIEDIKLIKSENSLLNEKIVVLEELLKNSNKLNDLVKNQNDQLLKALSFSNEKESNYLKIIDEKNKQLNNQKEQISKLEIEVTKKKSKKVPIITAILGIIFGLKLSN